MLSSLLFILVTAWLLLTLLIYAFQPRFVYFPGKSLSRTPADIGLSYRDIFFHSRDGVKLHGWYLKHEQPIATLLFLHGNAGTVSDRLESLRIFHDLGLSVFIIDYRGYGLSEGRPSEQGTYLDAEAAWNNLISEQNHDPEKVIIFGRSLGSAVAVWLAVQHTPAALILESAFTSITDMGQRIYPYLPVKWLARIRYPSIDRIGRIHCPVLVIHSRDDELIPYEFGQRLYAAAGQPKYFLEISGGHNDGFYSSGRQYSNGLSDFLNAGLH